jgi:geranylgeranyl transferase type-2 subunit alpha
MSHGISRKKGSAEKELARKEKESAQIKEYRELTENVMERVCPWHQGADDQRRANDYSKEAFDLTTALLKRNPEFYTVWNYRRRILLEGILKEYVTMRVEPDLDILNKSNNS